MHDINKLPQPKFSKPNKDHPLEQSSTYTINGKTFIVTPIFQQGNRESLGSVLLKLMKDDLCGA